MHEMGWSYSELMALPASYVDVVHEYLNDLAEARRRAAAGEQ